MNAYELADKLLSEVNCFDHQCAFDAASMLRQQADRIAELERLVSDMIYEKASGVYQGKYLEQYWVKQQSAEPVAWMDYLEHSDVYDLNVSGRGIPLYTAPQIKELSDEEIDILIAEYKIGEFSGFYVDKAMTESMQRRYKNVLDFARAILKKASEK